MLFMDLLSFYVFVDIHIIKDCQIHFYSLLSTKTGFMLF